MGYELHITPADNWAESDQHPIAAEEWLELVARDPELRIEEASGPYFAAWSGPCSHPDGGWFDWDQGCISTKHPDQAILGKMLAIAAQLGAVVQGDEGEAYLRPEDIPLTEDRASVASRPWWKFWSS